MAYGFKILCEISMLPFEISQNFEPMHRKIWILRGVKNLTTYNILGLWHLMSWWEGPLGCTFVMTNFGHQWCYIPSQVMCLLIGDKEMVALISCAGPQCYFGLIYDKEINGRRESSVIQLRNMNLIKLPVCSVTACRGMHFRVFWYPGYPRDVCTAHFFFTH